MTNNRTIKTAAAVAGAGVIAAGSLMGAGGAAAATPGDLEVKTLVTCQDNKTVRLVSVQNVGETKITGVRVGSVLGPEVAVPEIEEPNLNDPIARGNIRISSSTGTGDKGTLGHNQNVIVGEILNGCGGPYILVGYAIGNEVDNVFNKPNYSISADLAGIVADAALAD